MPAWWVDSSEQQFNAKLKLSGIDQTGLVNQVTRVISNNMNVDIFKLNFDTEEGLFNGSISVGIKNSVTLYICNLNRDNDGNTKSSRNRKRCLH